jgi:hypothetical protein
MWLSGRAIADHNLSLRCTFLVLANPGGVAAALLL